jgi:hypothetical protein
MFKQQIQQSVEKPFESISTKDLQNPVIVL